MPAAPMSILSNLSIFFIHAVIGLSYFLDPGVVFLSILPFSKQGSTFITMCPSYRINRLSQ